MSPAVARGGAHEPDRAGADAQAAAYVQIRNGGAGDEPLFGVGLDNDIAGSLKVVASAATRAMSKTIGK